MSGGWERIKELLGHALELDPAERDAYLARACGTDDELRAEVERLLALEAEADADDFLEPPEGILGTEPEPSASLGDFRIQRELGRGGMGVVYLARQEALGRDVALKVFVAGLLASEREVERFHREARSMARLRHPGIVRVIADGSEGNTHWFAMEYVPGHDLARELELQRTALAPGGTPPNERGPYLTRLGERDHAGTVARVGIEVAEALHFAHENGLVHRDVKPQNLLVQEDGHVLVTDFGIARDATMGALTRTGEVQGTPYYMSPEQARVRETRVDHRTDVYSLGVVLYELATLQKPFEAKTDAELLTKLRDAEPRPLRAWNPAVPRDLETICLKAMRKDPADRYATAAALAEDLRRFLDHVAIEAKPPSALERAAGWVRRRRGRLTAGVAVIVAASAAWFATDRVAAGKLLARLEVTGPEGAEVALVTIDPILGGAGRIESLGSLPLAPLRVDPGYARVVVTPPAGSPREFARTFVAGEKTSVLVPGEPTPERGEMVHVRGATVRLRDEAIRSFALSFSDVEVADFLLDATEVSNADYRAFLEATGHSAPREWARLEWPLHAELPVVDVGWKEARAYAEWRGKRLPTYPEWILAARGTENRRFPWRADDDADWRGNVAWPPVAEGVDTFERYVQFAAPVRSFPEARTSSGLWHMLGNVGEWTESWVAVPIGDPNTVAASERRFRADPNLRLVAGSNWHAQARGEDLTVFAFHLGIERWQTDRLTGFRCAVGIDPGESSRAAQPPRRRR